MEHGIGNVRKQWSCALKKKPQKINLAKLCPYLVAVCFSNEKESNP